jgi:hypothetical protein
MPNYDVVAGSNMFVEEFICFCVYLDKCTQIKAVSPSPVIFSYLQSGGKVDRQAQQNSSEYFLVNYLE